MAWKGGAQRHEKAYSKGRRVKGEKMSLNSIATRALQYSPAGLYVH